ncbi:MAG: NADH-quinone oxidoreductase subunit NuoF [Proteobacteria bacterium]|jgi:NADH-quinone oxidoreductase subunit F|nr:NADH-quinone oxidoreductase subunit NuoF [Pseudomonadota bacterium]
MSGRKSIVVGMSTCNIAAGAEEVHDFLAERVAAGLDADLLVTGCFGMCFAEPQVRIVDADGASRLYANVNRMRIEKIVAEDVLGGKPVDKWLVKLDEGEGQKLWGKQKRIVLANCGAIDPEKIDDYLARDGYKALEKVLRANDRMAVIQEITASGLRGRGGAGFSTGMKWKFAYGYENPKKYVVCNADEGDPGAFMDRTTLESDPHAVLEGMAIGAFATGANEAYIYCRAEYPLAIKRLYIAIEQATARGFLGEKIFGSPFSFEIHVKEGAGAFVCGEETALMTSIEGRRGMPRVRPPFPAEAGLFGKPTTINNVETWANVPWIIRNGAAAFAAMGTEKSKGTKVFALAGKIKNGGLVEVPMGITLDEIIHEVGGGTGTKRQVKAVQMGGPSGGCVPRSLFGTKIDYDEVTKTGAIMGSGGMVVMDETTCMVDVARYFLNFTQLESCGKCTFCRIGTTRMLEILTRICDGKGVPEDIPALEDLAQQIKTTSLCGLGQTAPNPVLTTLRYFRDEYESHIFDKKCRAGKCRSLCSFRITEACTGCMVCAKNCPLDCISGEKKQLHVIDQAKCIRCGVCRDLCKFDAVVVG